jgi:hypothetical protein
MNFMAITVTIAIPIKKLVATKERGERRESPHTPWPLVQPEPNRLPKPTSRPATISCVKELGYRLLMGPKKI